MTEIVIEENVSKYIERLFYEQNAIRNMIEYLNNNNGNAEVINTQIEKYSKVFSELEQAKRTAALKYAPKKMEEMSYYNFNFDNHSIEFHDKDEK